MDRAAGRSTKERFVAAGEACDADEIRRLAGEAAALGDVIDRALFAFASPALVDSPPSPEPP